MEQITDLDKYINEHKRLYIYGTGSIANEVADFMDKNGIHYHAFIVSDGKLNSDNQGTTLFRGLEVFELREWADNIWAQGGAGIIVAVSEKFCDDIFNCLKFYGINDYVYVSGVYSTAIQQYVRLHNKIDGGTFFKTVQPVGRLCGYDRGYSISRTYVDKYVEHQVKSLDKMDIRKTLEVGEDRYTKQWFPEARNDVLMYSKGQDLTKPETLVENEYDCFICTQVLNYIFDITKAMEGCKRVLRPGGILILTVAGNCFQVSTSDMKNYGDYWRFTELALDRLCKNIFGEDKVYALYSYGNAMTATATIQGLCVEDIEDRSILDVQDNEYSVVIGGCCVK